MTLAFQSLMVRSPRRVRLLFSGPLGLGAFASTWFSATCSNALGGDPAVVAALLVGSDSSSVELALSIDLAPGGAYELDIAAGVPGADGTTAPAVAALFSVSVPTQAPSDSVSVDDLMNQIFGVDVIHDGTVMVEDAAGDLATITGPGNVQSAVLRRLISDGLPHLANYGAQARDSNDAPSVTLGKLSGRLQAQARLDPRVISATLTASPDLNDGTFVLNGQLTLVGGALADIQNEPFA
jgi:hypothetical protein